MPEQSVKIFTQQAEQLYTRGVAAARGGQKAVAERLLRQAVKLNPQHEQAWLWLSGVLDNPEDVAFCLRSVLGINPANERARRGLAVIEERLSSTPATESVPSPTRTPFAPPPTADTWWSGWRTAQTTWLWTVRALLLIPIVLFSVTLGFRSIIALQPLPTFETYADISIPTPPPPTSTPIPLTPTAIPTTTNRDEVVAYFDAVQKEREVLQTVTESYRTTADNARTTVERVTATKQLRDQVQRSRETLAVLTAPTEIAATHQLYLEGLTLEIDALDQLLEFYRSYDAALANRAALRLQEARTQIATATASWDAFVKQQSSTSIPTATSLE